MKRTTNFQHKLHVAVHMNHGGGHFTSQKVSALVCSNTVAELGRHSTQELIKGFGSQTAITKLLELIPGDIPEVSLHALRILNVEPQSGDTCGMCACSQLKITGDQDVWMQQLY